MSCSLANKYVTSHKETIMPAADRQEAGVTKVKPALPAEVLGLLQRMMSGRDAHLDCWAGDSKRKSKLSKSPILSGLGLVSAL